MREIVSWISAIAFVFVLAVWVFPAIGLYQLQFWGVKYQNAQTEIYHHTDAYEMGNQRDFENLMLAYRTEKDPASKAAVLDTIRHRAFGLPANQVPDDVRQLINQ